MNPITKRDLQAFLRELVQPYRPIVCGVSAIVLFRTGVPLPWLWLLLVCGVVGFTAWNASKSKRFRNVRLYRAWLDVEDRHARLEKELKLSGRRRVASLTELPRSVGEVARQLYTSLRKADILAHEIGRSEGQYPGPPSNLPPSDDPQAQELYRLADRHLAEYKRRYGDLRASVERTEAQAVVFVTLLDSLRVQLLQHRLGRTAGDPETQAFLEAVTEAKMQLNAIDKTLEELELTPFPKTIVVVPPEPPAEEHQEAGN